MKFLAPAVFSILAVATAALAAPPATPPVEGLRENLPNVHAIVGAKIVLAPGETLDSGVIVVRDGVIVDVGADVEAPADARVWDATGRTIYPAFLDAYSEASDWAESAREGQFDSGAGYWNDQITPQFDLAAVYRPDGGADGQFRAAGFGARLIAPAAGIWRGSSLVAAATGESGTDAIVATKVALHGELTLRRRGRSGYPGSPMGAVALARQALHDAQWYAQAAQARAVDPLTPKPERNDALAALEGVVAGRTPVILTAADEQYFLRADRFAREFGLAATILGSGQEYRRLEEVAATGRTVILPVDFPAAPDVGTPAAADNVTLERLLNWRLAPENPGRLEAAGVRFALTSHGLDSPGALLPAIRKAIERGLSPQTALAALTTIPAELLGVDDRWGRIRRGASASFFVAEGDVFASNAAIRETWVQGRRYELKRDLPDEAVADWSVTLTTGDDATEFRLSVSGKPPSAKATAAVGDEEVKFEQFRVDGRRVAGMFPGKELGRPGVAVFSALLTGEGDDATWIGGGRWADGSEFSVAAEPAPAEVDEENADEEDGEAEAANDESTEAVAKSDEPVADEADADDADADEEDADEEESDEPTDESTGDEDEDSDEGADAVEIDVLYPLGAYGRETPAEQPEWVLFQGATVWTLTSGGSAANEGAAGKLDRADVLVHRGLIAKVGQDLTAPEGAVVVEAAGRHLTPGIIDCHSHIASDGGINEGTQAITCEVRIGDFVDATDVNIYRQLAGGVTTSNILHGSANPIGGQNQVLKFRWGEGGEALKFDAAPAGVKFALGENVKRSNGSRSSRYPQTRMGVEQIIDDAFAAAADYRRAWETWRAEGRGLPPRVDLELEALVEVIEGRRLVHCHSYKQDEILALIRTCERHGVQIATLQHILEGYKLADVMARHGAGGSSFSDWWAYKFEVYDAIPYNGALMHSADVVVSFNSDDAELARRLNLEAAKAIKYGGVPEVEALKFVTLNPAKQLRIDHLVGSIEPGKAADLVLWSGPPMSTASRCEQTWVDGVLRFSREQDAELRQRDHAWRTKLIAMVLSGDEPTASGADADEEPSLRELWPRDDEYCRFYDYRLERLEDAGR